ncbi:MAG: amidohydrolase family protein [Bacteroidia bacterium]|nr:amidohydrolase family protein [Bacteroidia bacterium]
MKVFLNWICTLAVIVLLSNETAGQQKVLIVKGATIHLGNGMLVESGCLIVEGAKIKRIINSADTSIAGARYINATGKHIYPGIIALNNIMGLNEIEAVRATLDFKETGEFNPNVRSVIAFNTDSKIIPTALSNGILFTQPVPQGGIISGTSSLMRTTGWNWEDAVFKVDDGIHLNWPEEMVYGGWWAEPYNAQQIKTTQTVQAIASFFQQANQYAQLSNPPQLNARFESMKGVFNGTKRLYVHASGAKSIVAAIQFLKQYPSIKLVLVDATQAWMVKDWIKEQNIPVVFTNVHQLPTHPHHAIDQPFKTVAQLVNAGVLVAIAHAGYWEVRNLPFNAGTAAAYGISKEQALQCITLNPAIIVGADATIGSLEEGKDASFVISEGDILDMRSSRVVQVFMEGVEVPIENHQKALYLKYMNKYGLEPR